MINQQVKQSTTAPLEDDFLIQQIIASKDDACIEVLYKRYSNKIYRKCLSMVKDSALAEDLMHDVFIKSLLKLPTFKRRSKFSTWLYSITFNHCMDSIRKRRRMGFVEISEEVYQIEDYKNTLIEVEMRRMMELLEMLKAHEKAILWMKYHDGLSIKEIQEILNVSESAIKMRLARAKGKVRDLYKLRYKESMQ